MLLHNSRHQNDKVTHEWLVVFCWGEDFCFRERRKVGKGGVVFQAYSWYTILHRIAVEIVKWLCLVVEPHFTRCYMLVKVVPNKFICKEGIKHWATPLWIWYHLVTIGVCRWWLSDRRERSSISRTLTSTCGWRGIWWTWALGWLRTSLFWWFCIAQITMQTYSNIPGKHLLHGI